MEHNMWIEVRNYLDLLKNGIPYYIYGILLASFCVGVILIIKFKRNIVGRGVAVLILLEYSVLVYCSTVIYRVVWGICRYDYRPFWSYNKSELIVENIMNTIAFIPIGLLLGYVLPNTKWWKVLLIGVAYSVSIETSQLFLRRGFSEVDDVFHNALGCAVGYGIYLFSIFIMDGIYYSSGEKNFREK